MAESGLCNRVSVLLGIAATLFLGIAQGQNSLTLVAEDDWFPYTAERKGVVEGMGVDIVRAAYAAVGVELELKSMPFARCMHLVEQGQELGCFNAARQSRTDATFVFHQLPLFEIVTGIFDMPTSGLADRIEQQDLLGHKVGFTNGYTYGDFLDETPGIERVVARTDLSNLLKLAVGRQHYSLIDPLNAGYLLSTYGQRFPLKPRLVGVGEKHGMFVAFSAKRGEAQEAANLLDQGLRLIQENGTHQNIKANWLQRYPTQR